MLCKLLLVFVSLGLSALHAIAQGVVQRVPVIPPCAELNRAVVHLAANGEFEKARIALSAGVAAGIAEPCTGLVLNNLASTSSVNGFLKEAESFAAQCVSVMEKSYPPDDPVLLCPLQILAAARFEQGEMGRAREAFKRMQSLRIERPEHRAVVHGMGAALLEIENRWPEAEAEYSAAIAAWHEAGRDDTADAGAVLNALGSFYIKQERWDEARQALDRALAIFTHAADAVPMDRIKLLNTRAAVHTRQGEWKEAERDLYDALSVADRERWVDPVALRSLLRNYAQVLRKNHRKREARVVEARWNALQSGRRADTVVDITELFTESSGRDK